MISWLKRVFAAVEAAIWPRRVVCLLCDELTDEDYLCPQCAAALDAYRLGEPEGGACSAYRYKAQAKKLVTSLKYDGMADAACVLARAMAEDASRLPLPPDTVVTWAAMPRRRRLVRGIDHGRRLAEEVAECLGLRAECLLRRVRRVRTQRGLNAQQRQENLRGVFSAVRPIASAVLIVDDVLTTGATMRACSEALTTAGAKSVFIVTATRVDDPKAR